MPRKAVKTREEEGRGVVGGKVGGKLNKFVVLGDEESCRSTSSSSSSSTPPIQQKRNGAMVCNAVQLNMTANSPPMSNTDPTSGAVVLLAKDVDGVSAREDKASKKPKIDEKPCKKGEIKKEEIPCKKDEKPKKDDKSCKKER